MKILSSMDHLQEFDIISLRTEAKLPLASGWAMASRESAFIEITSEVLLKAYACGIFPMAESADDPALYWIEPEKRGIIPLDRFHVPARLARTVRSDRFTVLIDRDFNGVLDGCAEPQQGRQRTWINARIRTLYRKLYERRHCHSVEVYQSDELVGGLYGVTLGRAFFGESMFHRARDASKVALVHLVARLRAGGFKLLDTQFVTEHLMTFGAVEVPQRQYHKLLEAALSGEGDFAALGSAVSGAQALVQLGRG
jgi:leucyl/phenylalanyl-tRNA--protein transferase